MSSVAAFFLLLLLGGVSLSAGLVAYWIRTREEERVRRGAPRSEPSPGRRASKRFPFFGVKPIAAPSGDPPHIAASRSGN
jgi:hypothetical protein